MIARIIGTLIVPLVGLAIGIGLIALIQKLLAPKKPMVAMIATMIVAAFSVTFAASFVGIKLNSLLGWIVFCVFTGTTFAKSDSWETRSIIRSLSVKSGAWEPKSVLRNLAITSGAVALYSAFASDTMTTVFALLATGILIRLFTAPPPVEDRRTTDQSSSAGAA